MIRMYFDEPPPPPHFHAEYGSHEALFDIRTVALVAGKLPPRAMGLVMEWASLHQDELKELWNRARRYEPSSKIEPLS